MPIHTFRFYSENDWHSLISLYTEAFPLEERRNDVDLKHIMHTNNKIKCYIVESSNSFIGFCLFWIFQSFLYIEHFALIPEYRSLGIGKELIFKLKNEIQKPMILEIEPISDFNTKRRFRFYNSLGFEIANDQYLQEPYRRGDEKIPMWLLSDKKIQTDKLCEIEKTIKKEVYPELRISNY